ncbi:conserved hypothetical protein [Candida dubliniensis CD36]|uniref:Uncharacterized protein n=1 Tax=Candida dubliniensis (strain CD36 / ATCC MYA-646 / CBS 7987 / NCPF 3949 / NRRL Y-17841) TaxID=573826 RepID=B9WHU6_CANDC|nr:conserved hypothetical protein [Candida dubliniensis CD36]CAX41740.1 conserved hypothetical protein [Candida dubliniensis CD36]
MYRVKPTLSCTMNDNLNSSIYSSFKQSSTLLTNTNEQLDKLWNLLVKFDKISISSIDINIEENDDTTNTTTTTTRVDQFISIEKFYKLLINYHKLIELITIKNNELTIMKFQCFQIIRNVQQQEQLNSKNNNFDTLSTTTSTISSSLNETGKKLQDIFNPKEEFDSTL